MKTLIHIIRRHILTLLALASFTVSLRAQEVSIPDPNLNAVIRAALQRPNGPLTQSDMLGLTNLGAVFQNITNLQGLEAAKNLVSLDLQDNRITSVNILTNLTRLVLLDLGENRFPEFTLPPGLTNLTKLRLEFGVLTNLNLPAGLARLTNLSVGFNQLTSLTLPADMTNLNFLSAYQNQLTNLTLPPKLTNLNWLDLSDNRLRSLNLPAGLTNLSFLALGGNQLTSFTVPAGMTNLSALLLQFNQLTNLTLPADLNHLMHLNLNGNKLTSLTLLPGLTSLAFLNLTDNQLTNLTLPPDVQQVTGLFMGGNPLTTLVLSEPLAITGMASVVDSFRNQGISVLTYPLVAKLVQPLMLAGSFKFGMTGPPGVYTVLGSTNLATWSAVSVATNPLGSVIFHEVTTNVLPQKFYRVVLQVPPANMVSIPPNTFTLGSPTSELDRATDEGPQTTVILTRGFWIGQYEVDPGRVPVGYGHEPKPIPW